jgi:glycosyltransferase involved in cell wall biosynthesis
MTPPLAVATDGRLATISQQEEDLEVSIVMPCLNEAATIERCITKATHALRADGFRGEVIIGDNGSTDGSQEIARRLGARVIDVAARGYGAALQGGIAAARGRYVIIGDADDSYDFSRIEPYVTKLREGYDLVMGNRFLGGIAPGAMPRLHRYLGNPVLTTIGRIFFRSPCGDFHCGMRGFRRDSILALDLRTTGMEFASEMIVKATIHRLRITEVPTTLSKDGRNRPPHLRSWRDGWRHLRFLLMYSPRYLFLLPGFLLGVAGTVTGIWLLPGPRSVGSVTFDVNTLLFAAAAMILGIQLVVFWLFAKVFATSEGLQPPDERFEHLFEYITLESGLVVSIAALLGGIALSIAGVREWEAASFGHLDPVHSLRRVIPAVLLMILGVQGVFSSFFLSILGLRRK